MKAFRLISTGRTLGPFGIVLGKVLRSEAETAVEVLLFRGRRKEPLSLQLQWQPGGSAGRDLTPAELEVVKHWATGQMTGKAAESGEWQEEAEPMTLIQSAVVEAGAAGSWDVSDLLTVSGFVERCEASARRHALLPALPGEQIAP
ncbi:hypothetical protein OKA04_09865 [Luteolibacter flavescens]|uniref:Uncharacterized protein n=1 Tax=Luteolibacter flavescens TaxID=1859460 RepID=A0ABT3FN84_9BACT|nr:hypothetical protein [Luteolibacter flavescens]MCW1885032.1 hypothetical protein [Luteolibacter flavescens]